MLPLTTVKTLAWEVWKQTDVLLQGGGFFPLFRHLLKPEMDKYFQLKLYSLSISPHLYELLRSNHSKQ